MCTTYMYSIVPQKVCVTLPSWICSLQSPKSVSFTWPWASRRMFSGFRSLKAHIIQIIIKRLRNVWTNHLYIYLPLRPCFHMLGTMLITRLQQFMKGCTGTCWDQSAAKKYFLDNLYTITTKYDTTACTVKAKFVSAPVQ